MPKECTGIKNHFYGKHHTKESKKKMSIAKKGKHYPLMSLAFKGRKHSEKTRRKMSIAHKLNPIKFWLGKIFTKEHKKKISISNTGKVLSEETKRKISEGHSGKNNYRWIKDRSILLKNQRNDPEYKQWVKKVKKRDNNICRINNKDCSGYCEVHHILNWSEYPELRYEVNNGITLCQAHHLRKRAEEKRLIPFFQELVSVSN